MQVRRGEHGATAVKRDADEGQLAPPAEGHQVEEDPLGIGSAPRKPDCDSLGYRVCPEETRIAVAPST